MKKVGLITLLLVLVPLIGTSYAVEVMIFEPHTYLRGNGKPFTETDSFTIRGLSGPGQLIINNGGSDKKTRVSSAEIWFNDNLIFKQSDFNKNVKHLLAEVLLAENNEISIKLNGKPGSYLTGEVIKEISEDESYVKPLDVTRIVTDPSTGLELVKDQIILIFKEGVSLESKSDLISGINGHIIGYISEAKIYQIEISNLATLDELKTIIADLKNDPNIELAARSTVFSLNTTIPDDGNDPEWFPSNPDDPAFGDTWNQNSPSGRNWGIETIYAPSAWDVSIGGSDVRIGVVDAGFNIDHEDLNIQSDHAFGFDNQSLSTDPDHNTHGTSVTGVIGAESNDENGITGIMWEKDLYVYKSSIQDINIMHGISILLRNQEVRIVNLSIGAHWYNNDLPSEDDPDDIIWFNEQKTMATTFMAHWASLFGEFLIIQSAGNSDIDAKWNGLFCTIDAPRLKNMLLIVGGINRPTNCPSNCSYSLWQGSNWGNQVDIVAPGTDLDMFVLTADTPFYGAVGGMTSIAAPHVTGVAGLVWNLAERENIDLTASQVKNIIINTADGDRNFNDERGYEYKILNAQAAVETLVQDSDIDGILDDGSFSGISGDVPCTGNETSNCDDNCPEDPNPDQADSNHDGIGDVCEGVGISWSLPQKITEILIDPMRSHWVSLVIDNNNGRHIFFPGAGPFPTAGSYIGYIYNNSEPIPILQFDDFFTGPNSISFAADSNGAIHAVYLSGPNNNNDVMYFNNLSGTWSLPQKITEILIDPMRSHWVSLVIDNNNGRHIFFPGAGPFPTAGSYIGYIYNNSEPIPILQFDDFFTGPNSISFAADSNGAIHAVYLSGPNNNNDVMYFNNLSGTWSLPQKITEILIDPMRSHWVSLVIDNNNGRHIFFPGAGPFPTAGSYIGYIYNNSEPIPILQFDDFFTGPNSISFAADSNGAIHAVYLSGPNNNNDVMYFYGD